MAWSKWYLQSTGIRRYEMVDGKKRWERLPRSRYSHCKTDAELRKYIERLNHRYDADLQRAKAAYDFKHRFISQDLLDEFEQLLLAEIPNRNASVSLYNYLRRYGLHWFITKQGLPDPIDWKASELKWGLALLNKGQDSHAVFESKQPVHPDTISKCIQVMNRFLRYMHKRLPKDIPLIELEPISKAQMRLYKAEYKSAGDRRGQFVTDAHWKLIESKLSSDILPFVQLGYHYGLRQSECLAISTDDIYETHLEISRQLKAYSNGRATFGPLKNRSTRSVPHWFVTAEECYRIVEAAKSLMHADTFGDKFSQEMAKLDLNYGLHDLRRTFITRAFRAGHLPKDIMDAAGHSDLSTTMRYAQDDRNLSKKRFKPVGQMHRRNWCHLAVIHKRDGSRY